MATLYRKYRPQNFEEVVGQNHIKITLANEIDSNKLAHAYIFCGPRAVGKTTLARVLAKAVNCEKLKEGSHEPCGKCQSCKEITDGRSLDIIEIDAASHTGVDNVRENIITQARVAPSRLKNKIFIIDEAHMLSSSAFNALLKVMEEPPKNVIFILCTTEIHKVPTTIISRCQRFDFKRININDIVKKLSFIAKSENIIIDKKILEAIARHSEGHLRDAESLLGQIVSIGGKEITKEEAELVIPQSDINEVINLIDYLSKKDAGSGITLINNLIDHGIDLKSFLNDAVEIARKILFAKINPSLSEKLSIEIGESLEIKLNETSKGLTVQYLVSIIELLTKAKNELKDSFIVQLPVELAIIKLCSGANLLPGANSVSAIGQRAVLNQPLQNNTPRTPLSANMNPKDIENFKSRWNEVLVKVKKYNHSLSFILRVCEPRNLNNNQLCLAFKYKFHKERVNDKNIKQIIEKVLHEVYDAPLTIEAVIDENLEVSNNVESPAAANAEAKKDDSGKGDDMIDNLLKTFGGKVVN